MQITKDAMDGLITIHPSVFSDERGYFLESFNESSLKEVIGEVDFVQDNESLSVKNVLRGLHFQKPPHAQGKLVRVIKGSVLDVVVDLRKNSKTYGQHKKIILSEKEKNQFYIPPGFAHGFCALEDNTIFSYKCTEYYHPEAEICLLWNDKTIGIDWEVNDPILSKKDLNGISFKDFISPF
jgi:dTDP-4-dehydrorhamnose 3,5-epimerase